MVVVVVVAEGAPPRLPGLTCCRCSDWLARSLISLEAQESKSGGRRRHRPRRPLTVSGDSRPLSLAFSSRSVKLCHRPVCVCVFAPTRRCCCLAAATRHLPFGPHTPHTGGEKKKKKVKVKEEGKEK